MAASRWAQQIEYLLISADRNKKQKTGEKHKRDKIKSTKNKHHVRNGTLEQGQGFALCVGLLSYLHLWAPGPVSVFQVLNQSKLPENSWTALGGNG